MKVLSRVYVKFPKIAYCKYCGAKLEYEYSDIRRDTNFDPSRPYRYEFYIVCPICKNDLYANEMQLSSEATTILSLQLSGKLERTKDELPKEIVGYEKLT
jgi:hypothetical protein